MAKVEKVLHPVPNGMGEVENLTTYLEDMRRKVNSQGDSVNDVTASITKTPDLTYGANEVLLFGELMAIAISLKTQLNALLGELRDAGFIARS